MRPSGRRPNELRAVRFERDFTKYAEGSVLVAFGETQVVCNATVEDKVPAWLRNQGRGWLTAEYGMLPRSTDKRMRREVTLGKPSGRTAEIQRLIGRALRAVLDTTALGERTITLDCDVLQADGGTRTAAISGSYVATALAIESLLQRGQLKVNPLHGMVAAVSVGIYAGTAVLDLDYAEDSAAETDMNVVMNDALAYVELQGTAEGHAFHSNELEQMLSLARLGIQQILEHQRVILR